MRETSSEKSVTFTVNEVLIVDVHEDQQRTKHRIWLKHFSYWCRVTPRLSEPCLGHVVQTVVHLALNCLHNSECEVDRMVGGDDPWRFVCLLQREIPGTTLFENLS